MRNEDVRSDELPASSSAVPTSALALPRSPEGGVRELLALAFPLVLSAGFLTVQLFLDRVFLTWNGTEDSAAALAAAMLFWTLFSLLQHTVLYSAVFVSQYVGAKRPERVGPVLWQAVRLAVVGGVLFLALIPLAGPLFSLAGHTPAVVALEADYFRSLCLAALPCLLVAVPNAFFSGRGKSWTVLAISGVGLAVNAPLAYAWVRGAWGFPKLGMAGAGYATAIGATAGAAFGLILLFRRRYDAEFLTLSGSRFDAALLKRLLRFGIPNGLMTAVDAAGWLAFVWLVGRMSVGEAAATNVTFTINLITFLPINGLGQGVEILVGRRQGEGRPDVSARTTRSGLLVAAVYGLTVAVLYVTVPQLFAAPFAAHADPGEWALVAKHIPTLLIFVAVYTLSDAINTVVSNALRGAGDTKFVAILALTLAWPVMVVPTWLAAQYGWGVVGAWVFATAYIVSLAVAYLVRFARGRWRTMKVIEPKLADVG